MTIEYRRLQANVRPAIRAHLNALTDEDRFTRFGSHVTNKILDLYTDTINFNRDTVIGALYRGLLVGVVHVAVMQRGNYPSGDLGISVDALCQGKGIGRSLFDEALLHAKRRKLVSLHIQYLRRNGRMASLCRGMTTIFEQDGEETACTVNIADANPEEACRRDIIEGIEVFQTEVADARAHILFIHGVAGDGWQWRENFLPYFAWHGFSGSALSLRGHGGSESRENITLRGYEEDLHNVLQHLERKPTIVVGHSMGGFLAQRVIEGDSQIDKASLITSVPPWGLLPGTLEPVIENMGDALGIMIAMQAAQGKPAYVNPDNISADVQIIGGERDRIIPVDVVEATARSYETEPIMIKDAGHAMISSSKWREVADHVARHLASTK
ncbi:alpha/beta fold hydrolase [Rhodoferax sp.]|uniref:alpha/beta fold hydrolase n=1 Tax=Rhodoferax sp. TaxID=50421 RepID=UPI0026193377|nr:alpha/beta fold hydrolase [Rhodoferax sp.]MDD2809379.1 alpha/beta fold hydrolase [Rhodoferax sp.]